MAFQSNKKGTATLYYIGSKQAGVQFYQHHIRCHSGIEIGYTAYSSLISMKMLLGKKN
ncbi:hypothetical protein FM107_12565 [Sphingobacterium sp. JB170]|nr:hypothetical protein FM107_12565 [Sphingobacterium sp. JB170]